MNAAGDTINFLATQDNDLANPANWSASTWTSADTLLISTANFTMPVAGLAVSNDMPASAEIRFGTMPAKTVTVDFGGHSLNTTVLRLGKMHSDNDRNNYVKAIGGFTGVTKLLNDYVAGHMRFYDGIYRIKNKLYLNNWYPFVHICSGAQLIVEDANTDGAITLNSDASCGEFVLNGGKFTILDHSGIDYNWQRSIWQGNNNNRGTVKFLNGSVYEDCSVYPGDQFLNASLLIKDSAYYATNGIVNARNTLFAMNSKKEITNSVFRTAQLYCGPYSSFGKNTSTIPYYLNNATIDFCDSEVTLLYRRGTASDLAAVAGFALPAGTWNNTVRIRGAKNRFTTQQFVLGGRSNTVELAGGTFAVSNVFTVLASSGARVTITNTAAYVKSLSVSANATNSIITMSRGARVTGNGNFGIGGRDGTMRVQDGAALHIGPNYLWFSGENATFSAEGASVTGSVYFASNNGRAVISDGTYLKAQLGPGWNRVEPLFFTEGKSNNVLVISNATYDCGSYFMKAYVTTVEGPKQDGVPFTNCPNCRIEFRGTSPKFMVTNSQASESNGVAWYGLVLGEMIDHAANRFTTAHYLLKDPVRVRYVLPTDGYAAAPLQSRKGILVLGGNAEFEFDVSEFKWPKTRREIPLVYDGYGYNGWNNRKYINVAQLNLTNADRLPTNPNGVKTYLKLAKDGKTLNLVVPGTGGMIIMVR